MKPGVEDVRRLRARLHEQSFLFDEPDTYLVGWRMLAQRWCVCSGQRQTLCELVSLDDEIHEFLTKANESIKQIERHVGDLLLALCCGSATCC
ncbi:MAG: hypothetical protein ABR592_12335 [Nitriliruptorales bacterium]